MKLCFFNRSYWPDQAATGQLLTELALKTRAIRERTSQSGNQK